MKRIFSILFALVLVLSLSVILAIPAMAVGDNGQIDSATNDPPIVVGAGWSATSLVPPAFFWSGTIPVYSGSGPFTFTYLGLVRVDVTDDFFKGDQFNVYDNAVLVGTTSLVVVDATSLEVGPDAAFADPTYSSGSFFLGPGSHSIEIEAIGNSFSSGRGYIRVVPLVEFDKEIISHVEAGDMDGVIETGEDWQWTMNITLKNVSGATITVDKVHDRLGGDMEWHSVVYSSVMGNLDVYTKGKTEKVFLNWYDGFDLAPGQEVFAIITVSPDINPGNNQGKGKKDPATAQEFTEAGEHCLNSGAYFEGYIGAEFISASTLPVCVDVEEYVETPP